MDHNGQDAPMCDVVDEREGMEMDSATSMPLLGAASETALAEFEHPPDGDFHAHEYGDASVEDGSQLCEKCASTDPPELAATSMVLHFLALTSGPSLTFLCFTLSEEFFVQEIGMRVLMDAGVLYAIPCLLGLLFFNVSKFFLSPRTTLVTCLILKTLFTGGIPLLVAARGGISAAALYVAMAVNGFCTGLLQSQTAAVCGLLPGTTADSLAHIGSFVSALMTTFVQGALLVATPLGAPVDPKTRMYILFPTAASITLYGLHAQAKVLGMPTYIELAAKEKRRLATLDKRVGKAKVRGRLGRIWWYVIGEATTWFVGLYMTAVVPFLRSTSTNTFLVHSFPTLLIMCFNVFNFLGSIVGQRYTHWNPVGWVAYVIGRLPRWFKRWWQYINVMGRLLYCVFFALYANQRGFGWSPVTSTSVVLVVYVLASFSNGFYTVVLSAESQQICGFTSQHLCPVVGTLVWIAMQTGSVLGFVASIASAPVLKPFA